MGPPDLGEQNKGSSAVSKTVDVGSNPASPAKYQRLRFGNCLTDAASLLPPAASIKCKDEKVYQLLQRVFRRADQEDDLAKLAETSEFSHPGHCYDYHSGRSALGYRLCFPISDDWSIYTVIFRWLWAK